MGTENNPTPAPAPQNFPAEAMNFLADKFKELKQEIAHLTARLETLEKQAGGAIQKGAKKIDDDSDSIMSSIKKLFE